MIILYAVPISLLPKLGKENRYFYTRHLNNNDRKYLLKSVKTRLFNIFFFNLCRAGIVIRYFLIEKQAFKKNFTEFLLHYLKVIKCQIISSHITKMRVKKTLEGCHLYIWYF